MRYQVTTLQALKLMYNNGVTQHFHIHKSISEMNDLKDKRVPKTDINAVEGVP